MEHIRPLVSRSTNIILGGDFNFVEDTNLDRLSTSQVQCRGAEMAVAACWKSHLGQLTDAFRSRHPEARSFTHFSHQLAARLDRLYCSGNVLPFVAAAKTAPNPGGVYHSLYLSDHRLTFLQLLPRSPPTAPNRARRRMRLSFATDQDLRAKFETRVSNLAAQAPADNASLLQWWPAFKREIHKVTQQLNSA